ncbi:MAG TPA: hydrogenase small subunit [Candidatus Aquicultor sp.]
MDGKIPSFPGISRRDFLKYCTTLAVIIGAGEAAAPQIAEALDALAKRPAVIWSQFMECTGCAVSLLQSRTPDVANLILRDISLNYLETAMAPAGDQAEKSFDETVNAGGFYYVVEGAVAEGVPKAITVHGKTAQEIFAATYKKAKATIAIGNCACYGNIQAAAPNPTGAVGTTEALKKAGIANPTVINIARCPGNAEDMLATLVYVLHFNKLPDLDSIGRPLFLYGQTVHDNCERRAHFEAGEFVETFGDANTQKEFCWFKVGCKGPKTFAPCPVTRWNGHISWCVHNGPCIGCAEPSFWDNLTPFTQEVADVHPPVAGISTTTIGEVLGVATAVGLGAHFIGQAATGRLGHGGPPEKEPGGEKTYKPKGGKK